MNRLKFPGFHEVYHNKKAGLFSLSGRSPVLPLTKDIKMLETVTLKCIHSLHKYLLSVLGTEIR